MRFLAARRLTAAAATLALVAGYAALHRAAVLSLRDAPRLSGWVLLGLVGLLSLYGVRKRFPYPPLLDASLWLQVHVWAGFAAVAVYLLHAGVEWPGGPLETALAALFAAVAGSGVAGLLLSRVVPHRLTVRGHEVIYERIPVFRRQLGEQARSIVEGCPAEGREHTLGEFWHGRLADFFGGTRHVTAHLIQSHRPLRQLRHELGALERYLDERERRAAADLADLIEAKDALDYHAVMQGLLRGWLIVHVPLTAALLVFAAAHAVVAQALPGGAR
jgi:hypothetical protein